MNSSQNLIDAVWQKAAYVDPTNEQSGFRKDACGAWINRSAYGDRDSPYGWEIDHLKPQSRGGTDAAVNLRPLHWKNNAARSDDRLVCVVRSNGAQNIVMP